MANAEEAYALQSMRGTEGWQLVEAEIRHQIDYHRGSLMDCDSWEKVLEHRGQVKSLEAVLVYIEQTIREGQEGETE